MRRHYTINSTICHFHETAKGILHEVGDLLNLITLPISSRKKLMVKWRAKLITLPSPEKSISDNFSEQTLLITEKLLPEFLIDAKAIHPERTLIDVKALISKIMQERLDAIVENDTAHQTHAEPGSRSAMLKASRATFITAYYLMNRYEKERVLLPNDANEWQRIKALLPAKPKVINERHLYALLALIAPIWPEDSVVFSKAPAELGVNLTLCVLIEILKSDKIRKTEKPKLFQEAISNIGKMYEQKSIVSRDNPEL